MAFGAQPSKGPLVLCIQMYPANGHIRATVTAIHQFHRDLFATPNGERNSALEPEVRFTTLLLSHRENRVVGYPDTNFQILSHSESLGWRVQIDLSTLSIPLNQYIVKLWKFLLEYQFKPERKRTYTIPIQFTCVPIRSSLHAITPVFLTDTDGKISTPFMLLNTGGTPLDISCEDARSLDVPLDRVKACYELTRKAYTVKALIDAQFALQTEIEEYAIPEESIADIIKGYRASIEFFLFIWRSEGETNLKALDNVIKGISKQSFRLRQCTPRLYPTNALSKEHAALDDLDELNTMLEAWTINLCSFTYREADYP